MTFILLLKALVPNWLNGVCGCRLTCCLLWNLRIPYSQNVCNLLLSVSTLGSSIEIRLEMASIHKLPDDIIKDILDYLESDSQRSVPVDRREHLSVESFRPPSPPSPSQAQDLGNFRLVCQKFSNLAIPYQFSRVSLRFSPSGFNRLDAICNHDHLARHTRKFSYLVPPFYGISKISSPAIVAYFDSQ